MQTLDIEIDPEVVNFVSNCLNGLGMEDPVPVLIYGKFSDEPNNNFRLSLSERTGLLSPATGKGIIYTVPGLNELFVSNEHRSKIENKRMSLVNDCVIFSTGT